MNLILLIAGSHFTFHITIGESNGGREFKLFLKNFPWFLLDFFSTIESPLNTEKFPQYFHMECPGKVPWLRNVSRFFEIGDCLEQLLIVKKIIKYHFKHSREEANLFLARHFICKTRYSVINNPFFNKIDTYIYKNVHIFLKNGKRFLCFPLKFHFFKLDSILYTKISPHLKVINNWNL